MAKAISARVARYFPTIISISVTGLVYSHSMVPVLNSSANDRMVTAGTNNSNNHGAISKNRSRDAYPYSRMLYWGIIHKKRPQAIKKTSKAT